jgi:hypothetical protein
LVGLAERFPTVTYLVLVLLLFELRDIRLGDVPPAV